MIERDLKIISDYISDLKKDPAFSNALIEINTTLESISMLRKTSLSSPRMSLSITLPNPESMRCSICSKTVIKP